MSKTALLVMDVQPGILAHYGAAADAYLEKIRSLVAAAHERHVSVVFVVVRFRTGYPEVSHRNKMFSSISTNDSGQFFETTADAQPAIKLEKGDLLVTKRRVSAFSGSDLDVVLRSQDVDSLVLCGIATSGVVLSTVREAADKDYALTVLADACLDADQAVHELLISKVFPRQADVVTSQEWIKGAAVKKAM